MSVMISCQLHFATPKSYSLPVNMKLSSEPKRPPLYHLAFLYLFLILPLPLLTEVLPPCRRLCASCAGLPLYLTDCALKRHSHTVFI